MRFGTKSQPIGNVLFKMATGIRPYVNFCSQLYRTPLVIWMPTTTDSSKPKADGLKLRAPLVGG